MLIVLAPGKKRPDGGNGGAGGNVYIVADSNLSSLHLETYHFKGGDGKHGSGLCYSALLSIPIIHPFR